MLFYASCSSGIATNTEIAELEYPEALGVVERADWGWVPIDTSFMIHDIEKITLHHGGVEYSGGKEPVTYLKDVQSWSRSDKNWIDNPYHFMIDLEGKIYECRPINIPGDTNTEYNTESHALICVMGNYEVQELSEAQLMAVINLCVYLAQKFDIPSSEIRGHKDYSELTDCPGEDFYKYLRDGTLVGRVNKVLEEGKAESREE
jgi:hypothetical protein